MHYNEAGELEKEHSIPSIPAIYHTLLLENPAASVEFCAACRLFHKVTYRVFEVGVNRAFKCVVAEAVSTGRTKLVTGRATLGV